MTSPHGLARALYRELVPDPFTNAAYQWGKVAAVHTGPASVDLNLDGSTNLTPTVRYGSWYTPAVGDVVLVARLGADRVVLGTLAK